MLGLVCMFDGKGMKKGVSSIHKIDKEKLLEAALFNIEYTKKCILFCMEKNYFYRISSSIIPYPEFWEWDKNPDVLQGLNEIKKLSKKIRLIIHPDQFVVLNSDSESVRNNSIKILEQQVKLAELCGIKNLILHLGKMKGAEKFKEVFKTLNKNIQQILVIENCHYYKVSEILEVAEELKIPMVLDVHHGRVSGSGDYDVEKIKATWKNERPLAHISSGKAFLSDKSHGDFIIEKDLEKFAWLFESFDVEIEAKKKEKALAEVELKLEKMGVKICKGLK